MPYGIGNLSVTEIISVMGKINRKCTFVTNEKLLECIPSVPHILLKDRHFILRWPVKTDWYTFDSFGLIHA
ncbi:MAG: hypothetical protein ACRCXX_10225, partial [Cetobacterium sp.]|uniref:hypothetical protein n=1 Tax=Cetobacterium sp. TaxID=2071632 RepID=UPI003F301966